MPPFMLIPDSGEVKVRESVIWVSGCWTISKQTMSDINWLPEAEICNSVKVLDNLTEVTEYNQKQM